MEKTIKKECIYVYNWIILLYSRVWHNIVNRLDFSKRLHKHTYTKNTILLLSHASVGQKSRGAVWPRWVLCLQSSKAGMRLCGGPCLFSWGWTHSQAHSGSELSSVSCSPGTEATLSLQTVDQGLVLAARVLAAFLHVLSALPVSLPLHPWQQRMTSPLYFRLLWHQWEKLLCL